MAGNTGMRGNRGLGTEIKLGLDRGLVENVQAGRKQSTDNAFGSLDPNLGIYGFNQLGVKNIYENNYICVYL